MQATQFEQLLNALDMLSEANPDQAIEQIKSVSEAELSALEKNRLRFFEAKSLSAMKRFQEASDLVAECINQAIPDQDYYLLVKCNVLQNFCYSQINHCLTLGPYLEIALEYAQQSEDLTLSIFALTHYLIYLRQTAQFAKALDEIKKLIDLLKRVPMSFTTTTALMQVSSLYVDMHKWDLAAKYLKQAITHSQILDNQILQLTLLSNLGTVYSSMADFVNAEKVLLAGLELSKKLEHEKQIILVYFSLGNLKIKTEEFEEALGFFDKCLEIVSTLDSKPPMLFLDLYNNYSMCQWFLKRKDLSLSYIDKAIAIAKENGFEKEQIQIEVNKTNLLVDTGAFEEAKEILNRAISFYKKNRDNHQLIWVNRSLAQLYARQNDFKKAYEINRKLDYVTDDYINEIMIKQTDRESESFTLRATPVVSPQPKASASVTYGFIGRSKAWQNVLNSALLAAQHQNTSVMISGESGTGKEVIAQIIHKNSLRRHGSFIPVNVGAITASLIESELFGHTKGAFTGANLPAKGFFLQADKGTLFLDEITEMPFIQQSKLLRALESRKIVPVGSSKEIPFDSRIISATNQDLRKCLADNKFRLDLYHRLNTIEIVIPPLRERPEDIEPIFRHYLDFYANELNKPKPQVDHSLLQMLSQYSFPGNARELKNMVERLFILSNSLHWDAQLLRSVNPFQFNPDLDIQNSDPSAEANQIIKALIKAKGKQKDAARFLNMSEATLYRRIVKHGLQTYTRKGS